MQRLDTPGREPGEPVEHINEKHYLGDASSRQERIGDPTPGDPGDPEHCSKRPTATAKMDGRASDKGCIRRELQEDTQTYKNGYV